MKCKYGTILKGTQKYSEKNVPYRKSHTDWHRVEPEPLRAVIIVKFFRFFQICSM